MHRPIRGLLGSATLALVAACSPPQQDGDAPPPVVDSTYTETGDFDAIQDRGQLRLLVVRRTGDVDRLPRAGTPTSTQIAAAARFARSVGLEPVVVLVDHFDALIPALLDGRGDVIVANLPMTEAHRARIEFTVALDRRRQMVAKRVSDDLAGPSELAGRTLTVGARSRYRDTAKTLQSQHSGLAIETRQGLSTRDQLDLLADGAIDLTLADSNTLETALEYRDGITGAFPVTPETGIGWGIRPNADRLKAVLDRFITQRKLAEYQRERHTGDLPEIKRRNTLRVVTRNSAVNYFVWRGELLGFEYELAKRFADSLGLRLELVVADTRRELLAMLREGRADVGAAFLTRPDDEPEDGIAYSRPYHHAVKQVVADTRDDALNEPDDLTGRRFHVRRGSDAWRELERLQSRTGVAFKREAVANEVSTETMIRRVASGEYDLTLVDDHIAKNAAIWNQQIRAALEIGEPEADRWAVRADNDQLLAAANRFLEDAYRGEFYNVLYAKYFEDRDRIRRYRSQRVSLGSAQQLTPYDELIQRYAQRHGLDWRLVAALMFQESGFNPDSTSWVGAKGLMQVMPETAEQVGVTGDLTDPETNIKAGTRYLAWLRERFDADLRVRDRMWFTLAAFNAGIGHVRDARRLAADLGLAPDQWFDNVERAMLKLSERRHFRNARFGYVRGEEPVDYVRTIRERYEAYILWTNDCWPNCPPPPEPQVVEKTAPATPSPGAGRPRMDVTAPGN